MKKYIIIIVLVIACALALYFDVRDVLNITNKTKEDINVEIIKEEAKKEKQKHKVVKEEKDEQNEILTPQTSYNYTTMTGEEFRQAGVIYDDNGTRFTYYSSNVLYHYRTPEWWVDENGMYRTQDGYVVVASNDYPQETIVDTPWGDGIVLDSGCQSGTIDIYVNF